MRTKAIYASGGRVHWFGCFSVICMIFKNLDDDKSSRIMNDYFRTGLKLCCSGFQGKKEGKDQESIHTIKYCTWPRTPRGIVTKTQDNITNKRAKRSALSQQETTEIVSEYDQEIPQSQTTDNSTSLQGPDKTVWHKRHIIKRIHKRITALEQSVKQSTGGLKHVWRYQPHTHFWCGSSQ